MAERREVRWDRPDARSVYEAASSLAEPLSAIDRKLGYSLSPVDVTGPSHLLWYQRVQDVPIRDLSTDDLVIALGQKIHLPLLIPEGLRRLEADPAAGFLFETQLLDVLTEGCVTLRDAFPQFGAALRDLLGRLRPQVALTIQTAIDESIRML